jgi:hypothetical protein
MLPDFAFCGLSGAILAMPETDYTKVYVVPPQNRSLAPYRRKNLVQKSCGILFLRQ